MSVNLGYASAPGDYSVEYIFRDDPKASRFVKFKHGYRIPVRLALYRSKLERNLIMRLYDDEIEEIYETLDHHIANVDREFNGVIDHDDGHDPELSKQFIKLYKGQLKGAQARRVNMSRFLALRVLNLSKVVRRFPDAVVHWFPQVMALRVRHEYVR